MPLPAAAVIGAKAVPAAASAASASAPYVLALLAALGQGASGAASGYMQGQQGKMSAEEMRRKTYADLLNSALQNQAEIQGTALQSSRQIGDAKTRNLMNTASTLRELFR